MYTTIAVIDDDVYIGNMLEEVLTREGYQVLRAYSGTEALLLLEQRKADVILLDLMLPGLSGEEILPKLKETPVIVISAKIDVEDKVKVLLDGAADYLTKPFDTKELLARITVQLRKQENKKEEILKVSRGFFIEQGYEKTSMRQIAAAADVSLGLVAYHFKTKRDIALEIVQRMYHRLSSSLVSWHLSCRSSRRHSKSGHGLTGRCLQP